MCKRDAQFAGAAMLAYDMCGPMMMIMHGDDLFYRRLPAKVVSPFLNVSYLPMMGWQNPTKQGGNANTDPLIHVPSKLARTSKYGAMAACCYKLFSRGYSLDHRQFHYWKLVFLFT